MDNFAEEKKEMSVKEKAIRLFKYLKTMSINKEVSVSDYREYKWYKNLLDFPKDAENITVNFCDYIDDNENEEGYPEISYFVKIHQPSLEQCPKPSADLKLWLKDDWNNYNIEEISTYESKQISEEEIVLFEDDEELVNSYNIWNEERKIWRNRQLLLKQTKELFDDLFKQRQEILKEEEDLEFIIANGIVTTKENEHIYHPIITKRVKLVLDAENNDIYIIDTDSVSEMCIELFKDLDVDHKQLQVLSNEITKEEYQPWDNIHTVEFMKKAIHSLSSSGNYYSSFVEAEFHKEDSYQIVFNPTIILRKRPDGTAKTINKIIDFINEGGELPKHLIDILDGGNKTVVEPKQETEIDKLAAVGGEDHDILLPKEANREQLEIAKRIENYNAVVVQGPPGTGKTHTIANLLGHFLSQGKSILVTSHTNKALRVLKEKVSEELQPLCVPVLDDSKTELEKSIEAIAAFNKTTGMLKEEIDAAISKRDAIIKQLNEKRTKLLQIKNQQCDNIVLNGESLSPIAAAKYVKDNEVKLGAIIPGKVYYLESLPLSYKELVELYASNNNITANEEMQLACALPKQDEILSEEEFSEKVDGLSFSENILKRYEQQEKWKFSKKSDSQFLFTRENLNFEISLNDESILDDLESGIKALPDFAKWEKKLVSDGIHNDIAKESWKRLKKTIEETYKTYENYERLSYGIDVVFKDEIKAVSAKADFEQLKRNNGKISFFGKLFGSSNLKNALDLVTINGNQISSGEDCDVILEKIKLLEQRKTCSIAWNKQTKDLELNLFENLDIDCPESVALRYAKKFDELMSWYSSVLDPLIRKCESMGIPFKMLAEINDITGDAQLLEHTLNCMHDKIIPFLSCIKSVKIKATSIDSLDRYYYKMSSPEVLESETCLALANAIKERDVEKYSRLKESLLLLISKYKVQSRRGELLEKIKQYAPEWAKKIIAREGIHGLSDVPEGIVDAWKWKQLDNIIDDLNSSDYDTIQKEANILSAQYRDATAQLAAVKAWFYLKKHNEQSTDLQQALKGWAYDMKKIGKGKGKTAKLYKEQARQKMIICQKAVPAWIMPIHKAIDTLDPATNRFDIVIVDEASQSDLTAMAVTFLGKKVVVVGDDKQVSPLAVGMELDKIKREADIYIKDAIPNSELYTPTDSLYTISDTTFESMMLLEHFRCVPEIIGFSNMLSYDYRIKPLREASSSNLFPAVINYRVKDGHRAYPRKINVKEAETIAALIKACICEPEYKNKTFGVISLLGAEQAQLIQSKLLETVGNLEIEKRSIICGDSASFQGDERDVIFLSMVASNEGEGPLKLTSEGREDTYKKRYNVAASRAKDQLWVVHSLDQHNDLKADDIRRRLLDYASNPQDYKQRQEEIKKKADSPFEVEVAGALVSRGYSIVQQWPVGAYRIDMVACYGNDKRIAIECDGEQFHSSHDDVLRDMQRQTILERIGWKFIRIRGSEYFRDKENTINRVVKELENYEVFPEFNIQKSTTEKHSDLLERVKITAGLILNGKEVNFKTGEDEENRISITSPDTETSCSKEKNSLMKTRIRAKHNVNISYENKQLELVCVDESNNTNQSSCSENITDNVEIHDSAGKQVNSENYISDNIIEEENEEDLFYEVEQHTSNEDYLLSQNDINVDKDCLETNDEQYVPNLNGLYPGDEVSYESSDGCINVTDKFGHFVSRNSVGQRMRYLLSDSEIKRIASYRYLDDPVLTRQEKRFMLSLLEKGGHILNFRQGIHLEHIISSLDVYEFDFSDENILDGTIIDKKSYIEWLSKYSLEEMVNGLPLKPEREKEEIAEDILKHLSDVDFEKMVTHCDLSRSEIRTLRKIQKLRGKHLSYNNAADLISILETLEIYDYEFSKEVTDLLDEL